LVTSPGGYRSIVTVPSPRVPPPRRPRVRTDVQFSTGRTLLLIGAGLLVASLVRAIGSPASPGPLPDIVSGLLAGAGVVCLVLALVARFIGFLMGPLPGDLPATGDTPRRADPARGRDD
jgi:hypothetical protein